MFSGENIKIYECFLNLSVGEAEMLHTQRERERESSLSTGCCPILWLTNSGLFCVCSPGSGSGMNKIIGICANTLGSH